ncbi:diguanylate cyclase domain-containing protein [Litoribrevibacter euphylliae]|uniref:Diguanylate cyclase domain-containing protein n=1 Tax=Litoribrevibacter euphylliae TaxID=1834034 RepID=A0ABV7H7A4_9GAMM
MTLVAKIATVISTAFITFLAIQLFNHKFLVAQRMDDLEKSLIQRELTHSQFFIESQIQDVETLAIDWGIWDENYHFVKKFNQGFIERNLDYDSLKIININAMIWITQDRRVHHGFFRTKDFILSESLLHDFLTQHGTLIDLIKPELPLKEGTSVRSLSGLLIFNGTVYILAVSEVKQSTAKGPSAGWFMTLREAPGSLFQRHKEGLDTFSELKPLNFYSSDSSAASGGIYNTTYQLDMERVTVRKTLKDIYGKPNIMLSSNMPRTIMEQSQKDFASLFSIEVVVSLSVALLAFYYLRQHISAPISKLIKEIDQAPSLEQARISEISNQSGELSKLIYILKSAVEKLNANLLNDKVNRIRTEQQNRLLFELANDRDLTEGHLHQSFYKILTTLIQQTGFVRASIWLLDQDMRTSECYASYSLHGDNIDTGISIHTNQLTKSLFKKLNRQRSFVTNLNQQVTESLLGTKVYEQAIISPIMISQRVAGALITEFTEEQEHKVATYQLFIGSLSELCSNSLYAHERKQLHEQLNHMAHHDPLTKLPNRSLFEEIANKTIARAKREHGGFSLLFVDLDKFKPVNDQYSHSTGDEVLIQCAERLQQRLRQTDTVARIGGDEFLILLENTRNISDARVIATQIIESISQVFEVQELQIRIGCSIGVAVYPLHGATIKELVLASDQAMYAVKASGRGAISVASPASKAS